jgi:hypothetical protein
MVLLRSLRFSFSWQLCHRITVTRRSAMSVSVPANGLALTRGRPSAADNITRPMRWPLNKTTAAKTVPAAAARKETTAQHRKKSRPNALSTLRIRFMVVSMSPNKLLAGRNRPIITLKRVVNYKVKTMPLCRYSQKSTGLLTSLTVVLVTQWVYIIVVLTSAWPNNVWMVRISSFACKRCVVAELCRNGGEVTRLVTFESRTAFFNASWSCDSCR